MKYTDKRIRDSVANPMARDGRIGELRIYVHAAEGEVIPEGRVDPPTVRDAAEVENGAVSLSGEVPAWMDKDAIYSAALYIGGVVDVEDNLTIETTIG